MTSSGMTGMVCSGAGDWGQVREEKVRVIGQRRREETRRVDKRQYEVGIKQWFKKQS